MIQQIPETQERLEELELLRRDAGTAPDEPCWSTVVVKLHEDFDRLVSALDSGQEWTDPREVLDPSHDLGIDFEALFNICVARLARAEGDEKLNLQAVKSRLVQYAARNRLGANA